MCVCVCMPVCIYTNMHINILASGDDEFIPMLLCRKRSTMQLIECQRQSPYRRHVSSTNSQKSVP